jgi:hypothetical protein
VVYWLNVEPVVDWNPRVVVVNECKWTGFRSIGSGSGKCRAGGTVNVARKVCFMSPCSYRSREHSTISEAVHREPSGFCCAVSSIIDHPWMCLFPFCNQPDP